MSIELKIKTEDERVLEDGSIEGVFVVEPLFRGFGHTIGNTLRRILLSRIEGAAVTHVRIEGANHEFTSVEGLSEDVLDVILNLKSLVLKMHADEEKVLTLKANNTGIVTAAQIECPQEVEIINKDLEIANLAPGSSLNMEIFVSKGRGYTPGEEHGGEAKAVDVIPVDSVFMPIKNVSYTVEPIRVSQGQFDKLVITILSNGSISISDAVGQAAAQLIELLNPIVDYTGQKIGVIKTVEEAETREEKEEDRASNVSVEELELSVRSYNCLKRANINSLGDLLQLDANQLMSIKNFGKKSAEEVIEKLKTMGHDLTAKNREMMETPAL